MGGYPKQEVRWDSFDGRNQAPLDLENLSFLDRTSHGYISSGAGFLSSRVSIMALVPSYSTNLQGAEPVSKGSVDDRGSGILDVGMLSLVAMMFRKHPAGDPGKFRFQEHTPVKFTVDT